MIFQKIFEKIVTLKDVNIIYSIDIDNILLNKIKDTFEKKCYKSCYILLVNKIIRRSNLNFNNKDLNASVNISIMFEATILKYDIYDIINNVKIITITDDKIICQSDSSSILIKSDKNLDSFKMNQIISVRVGKCSYTTGESKISITAFPFIPIIEEDIFYKIKELTKNEKEELNNSYIMNIINEEENIKKDILKKLKNKWNYFNNLLYPYKTNKKLNKNIKEIDIFNFDLIGINIISLSSHQNISNQKIYLINSDIKSNQKKFGSEEFPIEEKSLSIYIILLTKYYKHIKCINELSNLYSDTETFDNHINIFDLYIKYKV